MTVAVPVVTKAETLIGFEKLPSEAVPAVTVCLVDPPWTMEIVTDLPDP